MVTHIYHGNTYGTLVIKDYLLYYSVSILIESDSIPFRHFSKKIMLSVIHVLDLTNFIAHLTG